MSKPSQSKSGSKQKAQRQTPKRQSSDRSPRKERKTEKPKRTKDWEIQHPNAAGIDVGSREHWVSVPKRRAEKPVQGFGTTTPELKRMVQWLKACGVKDVAMESTGMYWLPVYEELEEAGLRVILVDARQTRNVSGRKSDQSDCEWIQQLHTYGLLKAAFRPEDAICRLRTVQRHRKAMVEASAMYTQHMQKALDGMNLHIHHALSALNGKSGMAMIEAIVAGERSPKKLAAMADRRVKKSAAELEAALTGNYREEELFVLEQSLANYRQAQQQVEQCDRKILQHLEALSEKSAAVEAKCNEVKCNEVKPEKGAGLDEKSHQTRGAATKPERRIRRLSPEEQRIAGMLEKILGVDLTVIPGLGVLAVLTLLSEIGTNMKRWRNAKAFASWLGLCPNHKISGGRVLSSRSRKVINRAASTLRVSAMCICNSQTPLGCFYRRKAAQFGAPKAITATAHKMACLIYEMISTGSSYREITAADYQANYDRHRIESLRKRVRKLGFALTKIEEEPTEN